MAGVRYFNVTAGSMHELRTQAVLQALDSAAYRRLSLSQPGCGASEALGFRQGCQDQQTTDKSSIEFFHDLCVPVMAAISDWQYPRAEGSFIIRAVQPLLRRADNDPDPSHRRLDR